MKNKIFLISSWLIRTSLYFLPDFPIVMRYRGWLYGLGMNKCGYNFQVTHNAIIRGSNISIGNNVYLANNTILLGKGLIFIDDEVMLGPHVVIVSGNHSRVNQSFRFGKTEDGNIIIHKGSWIAANSTITKESELPPGSILGANSLLNKRFNKPNSLYGGVPAKWIKEIQE